MNKLLRLVGLAFLVILATSAIATATASAEETLPSILPAATTFELTILEAPVPLLQASGESLILCKKGKGKGEFTTLKLGNVEIDFEGCESSKQKCNTKGDAEGVILLTKANTTFHLVDVLLKAILLLGLLILLNNKEKELLTIECAKGLLKILVLGSVIGEVHVEQLVKVKETLVLFERELNAGGIPVAGEQGEKTCIAPTELCEPKKGEKANFELKAELGKGEELAAESAHVEIKFAKEVEFHF